MSGIEGSDGAGVGLRRMTNLDDHVGKLLDPYRTGELGEADRLRVEGHLEACADCRSELEALAAFARTVERGYEAERAARAAEREPDWARLKGSIVARTSARTAGAHGARLGRYVPQAALAVLALVALGFLWEQGVRGPEEAERALRSERAAGGRADRLEDRRGGPTVTTRADGKERGAGEDRFADRAGAPPRQEAAEEVPRSPDPANALRRGVVLDDAGLPGEVVGAARNADRAGAEEPAEAEAETEENLVEADPVVTAKKRDETVDRVDPDRPEAQAREEVGKDAAAPPPDFERFRRNARTALSGADTLLAARALAQWRDSLGPRRDLPPELERAARALADSLAAFLANRP